MREMTMHEYEQRMKLKMLASAPLRRQRKAARAGISASRVKKKLPLSLDGDTLIFNGKTYTLHYAHGGLQVDLTFKADLKKDGFGSEERREIFDRVKKMVAESQCAGNILGAP